MTTPRDFTKNTGWGCANNKKCPHRFFASPLNTHRRTSTLHRHTERLQPIQASLFDILPTVILTDIEIWVSGLKHRDKFKSGVSRINSMYKPVLFTIPHEAWTPYHNFGVFRWYNEAPYKWVHIRIPSLQWPLVCTTNTTQTHLQVSPG